MNAAQVIAGDSGEAKKITMIDFGFHNLSLWEKATKQISLIFLQCGQLLELTAVTTYLVRASKLNK